MSEPERCISCGQPIQPDDRWVWSVWKRGEKQHTDPLRCIEALRSRVAHIKQVTGEGAQEEAKQDDDR